MSPANNLAIISFALLVGGVAGVGVIGRRRFYRRGPGGLDQFRSYGDAVLTRTAEGCLKLVCWTLILFGCLGLLMSCGMTYF